MASTCWESGQSLGARRRGSPTLCNLIPKQSCKQLWDLKSVTFVFSGLRLEGTLQIICQKSLMLPVGKLRHMVGGGGDSAKGLPARQKHPKSCPLMSTPEDMHFPPSCSVSGFLGEWVQTGILDLATGRGWQRAGQTHHRANGCLP